MTNMPTLFLISVLLPSSIITIDAHRPSELEYGEVGHRILEEADGDGDLEVSVKLAVRNTSHEETYVEVTIRALDADDFEVFEMNLSGMVPARGTRVLTDTEYVGEKIYKAIARWEVEE